MADKISGGASPPNAIDAILAKAMAQRAAPAADLPFQNDMSVVRGDVSRLARTMAANDSSQFTVQLVQWATDLRSAVQVASSVSDVSKVMGSLDQIKQLPEFNRLPGHFDHLRNSVIGYIKQDRPDLYREAHQAGVL